ncbi:MAG: hypothetical protein ABIN74_11085 [Ferruginibacter sp.]
MKKNIIITLTCVIYSMLLLVTNSYSQMKPINVGVPPSKKPRLVGPYCPADFKVTERRSSSIKLSWTDASDAETGNRLTSSTDGINWVTLSELGIINKGVQYVYTNNNLTNAKKYFYRLEVYGPPVNGTKNNTTIVTSRTPVLITFTGEGDSIPVFRVQLRIKTSNLVNADLDKPIRVEIGHNWKTVLPASVYTYLDKGHDDFEKGKTDIYDLNFDKTNFLADLGDIWISNTSTNDGHIIDSVSIIVNNNIVFEKSFRPGGYVLPAYGTLIVPFSEMAVSAKWNSFINAQKTQLIPLGLTLINYDDNGTYKYAIKIPREELIDRIEGIVGHLINEIPAAIDNIGWEDGSKPVELTYRSPDKISVDLDFWNYKFKNGALDTDFDLSVSYSCDVNNKLALNITTSKFTYDLDYHFLADIFSVGLLKAFDKLYDWKANTDSDNKSITKQIRFQLPSCINCRDIKVLFTNDADLIIVLEQNKCL